MIVDKINAYLDGKGKEIDAALLEEISLLSGENFSRQFGVRQDKGGMRLSSIGNCTRKQAYEYLNVPRKGKEVDARGRMVFFQGDCVELAIVYLMVLAGLKLSHYGKNQKTVKLDGVDGHPDAVLHGESEDFLVSVKSMSSYGFEEFQRGNINEDYLYQENSYLEAENLNRSVYVGLNKDSGVLHEHIITKNPKIIAQIKENIKTVRGATLDNLPPRKFSPDDKDFLPWNCLYCSHWGNCWPDGNLVLAKNKYRLKAK